MNKIKTAEEVKVEEQKLAQKKADKANEIEGRVGREKDAAIDKLDAAAEAKKLKDGVEAELPKGSFSVHNANGAHVRTYTGKDAHENAKEYAGKVGGEVRKA